MSERAYTLEEKLAILSDAAKYDVACTSSGVDRKGKTGQLGNSVSAGICHSFAADGRCITLLKILMTNECVFDCKYCQNRASNDIPRATFTPEEVCTLTMEFYRRNYIEGLFLSSGVRKNPTATMEQMFQALYLLRVKYGFRGYIHVKGVPGADPAVIREIGYLADRMSVNLELPTGDGLRLLAPHKTRKTILTPIRQIQQGIAEDRERIGISRRMDRAYGIREMTGSIFHDDNLRLSRNEDEKILTFGDTGQVHGSTDDYGINYGADTGMSVTSSGGLVPWAEARGLSYVPAGQSTQMIIGATPESDRSILRLTEGLYKKYSLKRVFYSAYIPLVQDRNLPALDTAPPLLREHRLYQADWLLRFYGFSAEEILDDAHPDFNPLLDPKCNWAVNHPEVFPVEVNRAPYELLLRVPGIGVTSARRIIRARRETKLDFDGLKKLGVVLKRASYFITCQGKMCCRIKTDNPAVLMGILRDRGLPQGGFQPEMPEQLSLFQPTREDGVKCLTGQL